MYTKYVHNRGVLCHKLGGTLPQIKNSIIILALAITTLKAYKNIAYFL